MKSFPARFRFSGKLLPVLLIAIPLSAQDARPFQPEQTTTSSSAPSLTVDQLANLIAPIALYPDPLLAQVLAASTYPLEIVEAQQWLQQNRNLAGEQLLQAAKQQNWDPSVQTLVAFPEAMNLLTRDIRWTTDVGNAFLAQQQDVMNAIQTLRMRAQSSRQLFSGPQQTVTTDAENGQSAIAIQPANPQVVYVPNYNPQAVWGPPAAGAYPPLGYSSYASPVGYGPNYAADYSSGGYPNAGYSYSGPGYSAGGYQQNYGGGGYSGFGSEGIGSAVRFGVGVILNTLFNGATHFSGWGWALNWLAHALFLNPGFFHSNGFGDYGYASYGGGYGGYSVWAHNPMHRLGIAYPNHFVAARFAGHEGYGARFGGNSGFRSEAFRSAGYRENNFSANRFSGAASYAANGGFRGDAGRYSNGFREGQNGRSPSGFTSQNYESRGGYSGNRSNFNYANRGYQPQRQFAQSFAPSNSGNRFFGGSNRNESHFSAPKMPHESHEHFSAPKASHFSAPHSSGGHHNNSGGGHSSRGSKHH